jgi:hypothetical protein
MSRADTPNPFLPLIRTPGSAPNLRFFPGGVAGVTPALFCKLSLANIQTGSGCVLRT